MVAWNNVTLAIELNGYHPVLLNVTKRKMGKGRLSVGMSATIGPRCYITNVKIALGDTWVWLRNGCGLTDTSSRHALNGQPEEPVRDSSLELFPD